jgi:hypothetical protein
MEYWWNDTDRENGMEHWWNGTDRGNGVEAMKRYGALVE